MGRVKLRSLMKEYFVVFLAAKYRVKRKVKPSQFNAAKNLDFDREVSNKY